MNHLKRRVKQSGGITRKTLLKDARIIVQRLRFVKHPGGGGGGVTPLYKVYRYVPPQRVWFLSRFGLKTGIDFDNYGLKSGRVFGLSRT